MITLLREVNGAHSIQEKIKKCLKAKKREGLKKHRQMIREKKLKEIGLHAFRHWKAVMEYHKTIDILHMQQVLGHRNLWNTLIYINLEKALFQNADDEFHAKVAQSLDEACKLLEVDLEYVTDMNGTKLFKKRKQSFMLAVSLLLLL